MNPFAAALGEVVIPVWDGQSRTHRIQTTRDLVKVNRQGYEVPGVLDVVTETARAPREARAPAPAVEYMPLEPGRQRRRRMGADGLPVPRAKNGTPKPPPKPRAKPDIAAIVRSAQRMPELPPAPVEPAWQPPVRAPGEMTYGAAMRLMQRTKDGELVDDGDFVRAFETISKAKATGAIA